MGVTTWVSHLHWCVVRKGVRQPMCLVPMASPRHYLMDRPQGPGALHCGIVLGWKFVQCHALLQTRCSSLRPKEEIGFASADLGRSYLGAGHPRARGWIQRVRYSNQSLAFMEFDIRQTGQSGYHLGSRMEGACMWYVGRNVAKMGSEHQRCTHKWHIGIRAFSSE